jgi:hypothetical protein
VGPSITTPQTNPEDKSNEEMQPLDQRGEQRQKDEQSEQNRQDSPLLALPFRQSQSEFTNEIHSPLRIFLLTWLVAVATCGSVGFTIYFAYNASLESPLSDWLIFSRPELTILVLSGSSQITIFLLGVFTDGLLENVRWAFASGDDGVSALSTLALSPATGYIGVLVLLFSGLGWPHSGKEKWKIKAPLMDNYRIWGCQRYLSFERLIWCHGY